MTVQYGDSCMSLSKVYEWVEKFEGGQASVDHAYSGCPLTGTCFKIKEQFNQYIQDNQETAFMK
jgi:hypothetical protein